MTSVFSLNPHSHLNKSVYFFIPAKEITRKPLSFFIQPCILLHVGHNKALAPLRTLFCSSSPLPPQRRHEWIMTIAFLQDKWSTEGKIKEWRVLKSFGGVVPLLPPTSRVLPRLALVSSAVNRIISCLDNSLYYSSTGGRD